MSMENKDLPAFPLTKDEYFANHRGLTKREYFAAMAMQGMLAGMGQPLVHPSEYGIGRAAVAFADDLLQELSKTPNL